MADTEISGEKICFKCGKSKPLNEFYKHSQMADGHLNKCKECNKKDVSENYHTRRGQYAEYEQRRWQRPERRAKAMEYQRRTRANNPEKYKAKSAVSNAVRDGRLEKKSCELCGDPRAQAHHWDYSKPLDVQWLCRSCHLMVHGKQAYEFEQTTADRGV